MVFVLRSIGILVIIASLGALYVMREKNITAIGVTGVLAGILFLLSALIARRVWRRRSQKLQRDWQARMRFNPEYEELRKKRKEYEERQAAKANDGNKNPDAA